MSCYCLYSMHPYNGRVAAFTDFDAPDDACAISLARAHEGDHPVELWCEGRKVLRIEAMAQVPVYRHVSA